MANEELFPRQAVVFASGLIYWAGVLVQARRVRRQIGRSPNLRPRSGKEKLLWMGWFLVIAAWLIQPFCVRANSAVPGMALMPGLLNSISLVSGLALVVGGYAATLWSYAVMGSAWRIGVNPGEKSKLVTAGPFRLVRHPLYLFQIIMLAGAFLLLPTLLSLLILIVHLVCVLAKAADEESHLEKTFGQEYRDYMAHTGRLFPKLRT